MAKHVGISQSKLSKIETGALVASTEDLQRIFAYLSAPKSEAKRLLEWARNLRSEYVSWRVQHRKGFSQSQLDAEEVEAQATRIRVLQISVIPGLLQIPSYARRVIELCNTSHQDDVERAVILRIKRQQLLYEPERNFEFIIFEPAILSRFCDPQVVIQQLNRLSVLFELTNVRIGFVPSDAAYPRIPLTSFCVFDSASVVVETSSGDFSITDEQDVQVYNDAFDAFSKIALFGSSADTLIANWQDTLKSVRDTMLSIA